MIITNVRKLINERFAKDCVKKADLARKLGVSNQYVNTVFHADVSRSLGRPIIKYLDEAGYDVEVRLVKKKER